MGELHKSVTRPENNIETMLEIPPTKEFLASDKYFYTRHDGFTFKVIKIKQDLSSGIKLNTYLVETKTGKRFIKDKSELFNSEWSLEFYLKRVDIKDYINNKIYNALTFIYDSLTKAVSFVMGVRHE